MTPFYLITQDDEPWKLPITVEHLSKFEIKPRVIYGLNGHLSGLRTITPHDVKPNGEYDHMHPSAIGCVLSHIMALTLAVSEESGDFIIAEDDVELADGFTSEFSSCRKDAIESGYKILQLEHLNVGKWIDGEKGNAVHLRRAWHPFGTACIWWTRDAAIQSLRMLRPVHSPYDIMLIRHVYPFIPNAAVFPQIARQRTSVGEWPSSVGCRPKEFEKP